MTADPADCCCWGGCREEYALHYFTRPLCRKHWASVCAYSDVGNAAHLAKMLKLPLERMERTMQMANAGIEVTP